MAQHITKMVLLYCGPNPKKLNPDSTTIIPANNNVACTITTLNIFGKRCFKIILYVGVPIDFAAKKYSFSFLEVLYHEQVLQYLPQLNTIITRTSMADP